MQTTEYGFDLTEFRIGAWERICALIDLEYAGRDVKNYNTFMWTGLGLIVITTNNPITGEYHLGDHIRKPEIGFVGYISVIGKINRVAQFKKSVLERALYVKNHGEGRNYI